MLGAATRKSDAAMGVTTIGPLVPVIAGDDRSVAVTVWLPTESSVALNAPTPLAKVEFAGSKANGSGELK